MAAHLHTVRMVEGIVKESALCAKLRRDETVKMLFGDHGGKVALHLCVEARRPCAEPADGDPKYILSILPRKVKTRDAVFQMEKINALQSGLRML